MKIKDLPKVDRPREKLEKQCAICGGKINLILYNDSFYRGGHYFGKIPICSKKETDKALKAGTRKTKIGEHFFEVLKKEPKPYKHVEYWECPKCYWGSRKR